MEKPPPLPPLQNQAIDAATLDRLFDDIATYADQVEITAKQRPGTYSETAKLTPAAALELLRARAVRGVQIRYRWDGKHWMDTLIVDPAGWRIVRIEVGA